jgi:hypothetical protein
MRQILFAAALLTVCYAPISAVDEVGFAIKGGIIDNYSQKGLDLPVCNVNRLNLIGGQFHISKLPVVELIVGADYSWRGRTYVVDNQKLEFRVRNLAVTASVVYPVRLSAARLYLGCGIGSHSISYEYLRPAALALEDYGIEIPGTSAYFGCHAVAGGRVNIPSIPVGLFVETRLYHIDAPKNDISYSNWSGGIFLPLE